MTCSALWIFSSMSWQTTEEHFVARCSIAVIDSNRRRSQKWIPESKAEWIKLSKHLFLGLAKPCGSLPAFCRAGRVHGFVKGFPKFWGREDLHAIFGLAKKIHPETPHCHTFGEGIVARDIPMFSQMFFRCRTGMWSSEATLCRERNVLLFSTCCACCQQGTFSKAVSTLSVCFL